MFKSRKSVFAVSIIAASSLAVTGCFHDTEEEHGHSEVTISATNAATVVGTVLMKFSPIQFLTLDDDIDDASSDAVDLLTAAGVLQVDNVYALSADCEGGGTVEREFTDAGTTGDGLDAWSVGDKYTEKLVACKATATEEAVTTTTVTEFTNATTVTRTYSGDTNGTFTRTSGDTLTITSLNGISEKMMHDTMTHTLTWKGAMSVDTSAKTFTVAGEVSGGMMEGSVDVDIAAGSEVTYSTDMMNMVTALTGGEMVITGAHEGKITISPDGTGDIPYSVDTNGDGTAEVAGSSYAFSEIMSMH